MLAPNTLLQNRYLIHRPIGQGGMGAVYLAEDRRLGNYVALKETFFTDDSSRRAFEREARLLASLHHPALPRVIDHFGEREGQFLVMGFVGGEDLAEMLRRRNGPFPVADVLQWADQLLDALDYLHTQDPPVIHRDIKPQNIKLMSRGQIILLDFGLAKGKASQLSQSGNSSVYGYTPFYASLEQIQGSGTDARSDLYSLAATFYHLLTNTLAADTLSRANAVVNEEPDPLVRPDALNTLVPSSIADILIRAMALRREQRYTSAAEMRVELRNANEVLLRSRADEAKTLVLDPHLATVHSTQGAADRSRDGETLRLDEASLPTVQSKHETLENAPVVSNPTLPVQYFQARPIDDSRLSQRPASPSWTSRKIAIVVGGALALVLASVLALYFLVLKDRPNIVNDLTDNRSPIDISSADMTLIVESFPPQAQSQLAGDAEARKRFAKDLRELLALAEEAKASGLAERPDMQRQLALARSVTIGQAYIDGQKKQAAPGSAQPIAQAEVDQFLAEPGQDQQFEEFLSDAKARNPQAANPPDQQKQQLKQQWAQILLAERKGRQAGLDKDRRVELQIMLQEGRTLATQYAKEQLEARVKATETEIDAYIADHPEMNPEKARAQAEQLVKRARAGEDFAKLAKEFSTDPGSKSNGGDLGWFPRGIMVKPFDDAAFSMQPGQISDVVESSFGYHVIKVEDRGMKTAANGKTEEQVRARHILLGNTTQSNSSAPPQSPRERAKSAVEEKKQRDLIDQIVARSHVTVADDFQVNPPAQGQPGSSAPPSLKPTP